MTSAINFTDYHSTLVGLFCLLFMTFIQAIVASVAHRRQVVYVPGIVANDLGPESFVFRSHRTLMNSVENVPFMLALVFVAILSGFDAFMLSVICWVYVAGRFAQMITYYLVATRKNPSLRSYFYMMAILAQLTLLVMLGLSLL